MRTYFFMFKRVFSFFLSIFSMLSIQKKIFKMGGGGGGGNSQLPDWMSWLSAGQETFFFFLKTYPSYKIE